MVSWATDGRLVGRGLRQVTGAPGLFGGGKGRTGRFLMDPDTPQECRLEATFSDLPIERGHRVRIEIRRGRGTATRSHANLNAFGGFRRRQSFARGGIEAVRCRYRRRGYRLFG